MNAQVLVTAMNSNLNNEARKGTRFFSSFEDAYAYYSTLADQLNLTNAEYSDSVEMEHHAGGVGFDFRVELLLRPTFIIGFDSGHKGTKYINNFGEECENIETAKEFESHEEAQDYIDNNNIVGFIEQL